MHRFHPDGLSIDRVLSDEGGRILSTLIRLTGDFDLAEDALSDAVLVALERWPSTGAPDNPAAWLTTTARNKALDRIRRESRRGNKEAEATMLLDGDPEHQPDDLLRLVFTCCHPALSRESQVALSLRTLGGLSTAEIAHAFLVPETTMGQRISRAKAKIKTARIPYRVPPDHELPDRLASVLAVVYLIFTTGHHAPGGSLDSRVDLARDAIRLGRDLARLMPDEADVAGVLALMLSTHARSRARLDQDGESVLLADQNRELWDRAAIDEAASMVEANLKRGARGPYLIQAAISCLHGVAATFEETDWPQIVALYRMLEVAAPTPVVRVNRAVAEAQVDGPGRGLEVLADVDGVDRWHLYWVAKATFLTGLGRKDEAADAYRRALECDVNETDRKHIEHRLAELG